MSHEREQPVWTSPAPVPEARSAEAGDGRRRDDAPSSEARPLDGQVRQEMEARLGEDFSSVKVHAGPEAAESAKRLGARAYALGEDVVFGAGRLAPDTATGAGLLEHELGHVVEQRRGAPLGIYRSPDGEPQTEADPVGPVPLRGPPRFRIDPELGRLSLGLSTLSGFDFNGASVKPEHGPQISDVAGKLVMLLGKMPGGRITVTGHTDLVGGEDTNLRLGLRRAEVVRDALEKAGVPTAAMSAGSEGRQSPAVKTPGREPRNRRVEVRFQGELVAPGATPRLLDPPTLTPPPDRPERVDLTPRDPSLGPTPPRFSSVPTPAPARPEPKGSEGPPRPGGAGDVAKAIVAIPEVKRLIDKAQEDQLRQLGRLSTGEKVIVGTVTVPLVAGVLAGISTDPTTRKSLLDAADGKEIPVPGVPWLKVKPVTKGGIGGMIQVDIIQLVPGLK